MIKRRCKMNDKMSDKLLPCPFCGAKLKVYMMCGYWDYDCENDFCILHKSPNRKFKTEEELRQVLNTRKPMERIVERLEERRNSYGDMGSVMDFRIRASYDNAIKIVKDELN